MTGKKKLTLKWLAALGLPAALIGLFYLLRGRKPLMAAWVEGVIAPAEQFLGRLWAVFPFSAAELLTALALVSGAVWLVRAAVLLAKKREGTAFLRRLLALGAACLWPWAGMCWMWNVCYYAPDFTERSGLSAQPHTTQELLAVTVWFAQNAARLSSQAARDAEGRFAEPQEAYFRRGGQVYENLSREFPCLDIPATRAKPLFFSRLQSILGFTGVYFPFTGEANVNVDAPASLRPATIAHEMAHQRMVASELEASFVGIAAAVTSGDPVFQYSGFLMGLIDLSNALYSVSPDTWRQVIQLCFTPELSADWNENYEYWKALESPVDRAAEHTYDSFLKGNGQSLGIASYGACVDLLITYFLPQAVPAA